MGEPPAGPYERPAVSTRVNDDPDILAPTLERGILDRKDGNVLDNASASNLLDRKKGIR